MSSVRFLTDDALLAQCRTEQFRGTGPGGQKRNKTSNAVRYTHLPTRITGMAHESRSLTENKLFALRRLRIALACQLREPPDLRRFEPPDWFLSIRRGNRLELSHRHRYYTATAGLMLDLLQALAGNPAAVAVNLGISTTTVLKLLEDDHHFWAAANLIRAETGLPSLTRRGG